ncbi:galactosamine-6-phosphate isomerase [Buttiauxella gaviniae ATCC 51604]|uniref:Galactosamine-6-phosphate isomerase n=1 Tax=Buttiauxella gaviniae ATCC 51604 TaxID=1354253 RepID=A0A1B7HY19_9ENTR|nr:SIS domain-containing protein [Buttiauxella gaviniae]OAT20483.1 galactosamine-6-phosphate isomerase [Buttiauxella gaviniae ATCC 51604]
MLNHNEAYWQQKGASLTVEAIVAQPRLWQEGLERVKAHEAEIQAFWRKSDTDTRILITGAGSSLLAAQASVNWLRSIVPNQIDVVPATDLVLMPESLHYNTVLVSVSSSGNTPETVKVVERALAANPKLRHLSVTNNASSRLAQLAQKHCEGLFIPVPEGTSNGSFAATSEFTIPLWYLMLLVAPAGWSEAEKVLPVLQRGMNHFFNHYAADIEKWAAESRNNVVVVGSLSLKAVACETSLKLLEMGNGQVMTAWHSMLEFRHGPKLIINRDATLIGYLAARAEINRYDSDMMAELTRERSATAQIIAIGHDALPAGVKPGDRYFHFAAPELADCHESWTTLLYVAFAQLAGLYSAIALGVTPDMPSRDGKVAKVAKVTVY